VVRLARQFTFPANLDTIQSNTDFTIELAINNFEAGGTSAVLPSFPLLSISNDCPQKIKPLTRSFYTVFTNAKSNYFGAPAFTNNAGQIIGHARESERNSSYLPQNVRH